VIAVLVVVAIGAFWIYNGAATKKDDKQLVKFHTFLKTYMDKCNAPSFPAAQMEPIENDYLTSPGIQAEVDKQLAALNAGGSCADVVAKMRTADLTLPAPGAAQ
jgi:hypothetical protein